LQPLLELADASLETSVNQPTLPYAITVLNASELNDSVDDCSSESATELSLAASQRDIYASNGNPSFVELTRN
jgi:hypothetical protein